MARIFETTGKDIERLDAAQLTALLIRLITLEAEKNGIPRSCVQGTLNITASDQGEDAHIKWDKDPAKTTWFPANYTLFQCKATGTSPKVCEAEIVERDGITVKKQVDEVLSAGGAYVLFCTTSCNTKQAEARVAAFRKALSRAGKAYAATASIDIYHADKIALWVNEHVSAITTVKNDIGGHLLDELKTWLEWSAYLENSMTFVSDATLAGHITGLRAHFTGVRKLARIIGLSGVGKTRLALETFRPPLKPTDMIVHGRSRVLCACVSLSLPLHSPPCLSCFRLLVTAPT